MKLNEKVSKGVPCVGVTVVLPGQTSAGGTMFDTVRGNIHVLLFPALSIATHETLLVFVTLNRLPLAGHKRSMTPDPSVALTRLEKLTIGLGTPSELDVKYVKFFGQAVNAGGTVSTTST